MSSPSRSLSDRVLAGFLAPGAEPPELARLRLEAAVEQARSQIRYGNLRGAGELLEDVARSIGDKPDISRGILLAVAYSVWGQGLETWGDTNESTRYFRDAVGKFEEVCGPKVDDETFQQSIGSRALSDLGMALAGIGRHEKARQALQTSYRLGGSTPEAMGRLAAYLAEQGDLAAAEDLLGEVLPILPGDPASWYTLAQIRERTAGNEVVSTYRYAASLWLHRDAFDQALPAIQRLLELQPGDPAVLTALAETLRNLGRADDAEPVADRAVAAVPGELEPWLGRALVRRQRGQVAEALADIDRALEIRAADPAALLVRAYLYLDDRRLDQSLTAVEAALSAEQDFPLALAHKAHVLMAQGQYEQARDPLLTAYRMLPDDTELAKEYARLAARLADPAAVAETLTPIWPTLQPSDLALLVDALVDQDDPDTAVDIARARYSADPGAAALKELLASALARRAYDYDYDLDRDFVLAAADEAASLAPDHPDVKVLRGMAERAQDRAGEAERLFVAALKLTPAHLKALEQLTELLIDRKRWRKAETWARQGLEASRQGLEASRQVAFRLRLALILLQRDGNHEVLSLLAELPSDVGDLRATWLSLRAEAAEAVSRWGQAQADRAAVTKLTPDDMDAWFALAEAARMAGDWDTAIQASRKVLAQRPADSLAHGSLGAALAASGQEELAREELDKAIDQDPRFEFALTERARLAGTPKEMHEYLARMQKASKDQVGFRLDRARVLMDHRQYGEALADFKVVLAAEPDNLPALIDAANCHLALGQIDEAAVAAGHAIELEPDNAPALQTLAAAKNGSGAPNEALVYLQRAKEIVPYEVGIVSELASTLRILDRIEESLTVIDEFVMRQAHDPAAWSVLGGHLTNLGYFDEAVDPLRRSLALNSEDAWVHSSLGTALALADQPDLRVALAEFEEANRLEPDDPWYLKDVADARHELGLDGTEVLYHRAIEQAKAGQGNSLERQWNIGWCLFRLRDLGRAGRQLFAATALPVTGYSARMDLGLVSLCRHRDDEALQHYQSAVTRIREWDARRRRNPLRIAQSDLEVGCRDWPDLAVRPATKLIRTLLAAELVQVPALPDLQSLRRPVQ